MWQVMTALPFSERLTCWDWKSRSQSSDSNVTFVLVCLHCCIWQAIFYFDIIAAFEFKHRQIDIVETQWLTCNPKPGSGQHVTTGLLAGSNVCCHFSNFNLMTCSENWGPLPSQGGPEGTLKPPKQVLYSPKIASISKCRREWTGYREGYLAGQVTWLMQCTTTMARC